MNGSRHRPGNLIARRTFAVALLALTPAFATIGPVNLHQNDLNTTSATSSTRLIPTGAVAPGVLPKPKAPEAGHILALLPKPKSSTF